MTLLYQESFDWLSSADIQNNSKFAYNIGAFTANSTDTIETGGRTANCLQIDQTDVRADEPSQANGPLWRGLVADQEYVVGFGCKWVSAPGNADSWPICNWTSPTNQTTSAELQYNPATQTLNWRINIFDFVVPDFSFLLNVWYYFEMKFVMNTSNAGTGELRIDGVPKLTVSNVDWNFAPNAFMLTGSYGIKQFDDFYLLDTNGLVNNDFLGGVRSSVFTPNADGFHNEFDVFGAVNRWEAVQNRDGDATYVQATALNQKQTFAFSDLSGSSVVHGVTLTSNSRKADIGPDSMQHILRSAGGTELNTPTLTLQDSYTDASTLHETDAEGAAWTEATLNSHEFGVQRVV